MRLVGLHRAIVVSVGEAMSDDAPYVASRLAARDDRRPAPLARHRLTLPPHPSNRGTGRTREMSERDSVGVPGVRGRRKADCAHGPPHTLAAVERAHALPGAGADPLDRREHRPSGVLHQLRPARFLPRHRARVPARRPDRGAHRSTPRSRWPLLVAGRAALPGHRSTASGSDLVFFTSPRRPRPPPWVILPVVFVAVAAVMAGPGELVGRCFTELPRLDAYRYDLIGSLIGIVAFTGLSFLRAPPLVVGPGRRGAHHRAAVASRSRDPRAGGRRRRGRRRC